MTSPVQKKQFHAEKLLCYIALQLPTLWDRVWMLVYGRNWTEPLFDAVQLVNASPCLCLPTAIGLRGKVQFSFILYTRFVSYSICWLTPLLVSYLLNFEAGKNCVADVAFS